MNPMERFRSNLKVACTLKIEPEMWFSQNLANYIRHLASYYQVDAHAMVLAVINGVATTCQLTYVNRASHFLVPCNLFNLLVARSGYSKSSILDLAEVMAETAACFHRFEVEKDVDEQSSEQVLQDELEPCTAATTTSKVLKPKIVSRISSKVIFNDGTSAGVLNNLKQSTKTMHLHEADVTLKSSGFMLPSPMDIIPTRVDPFRSTLMTLHEKPGHFIRVLKNEKVDVSGSKLNIFGASTGDLIAAELARQAASLSSDAFFERFVLWPLDGEPIPNNKCITSIDFSQYCSLEQFAVLCGFLANLILGLEQDGKDILADQAFEFRIAGSQNDVQDNISARLNKTALVAYRIVGLCGLLEAAFDMASIYIDEYVTFGNGEANELFFHRSSKIAERQYGPIIRKEQRFTISTDVCKRAQNVTIQNLAQYMALMKISKDDKKNWLNMSGRNMKPAMRFIATNENNELVEPLNISCNSINITSKLTLPLTRKQQNMLKKSNSYKASILLHPSLVFLKSNLYVNSFLKKASSLMESNFLKPLVDDKYLVAIPNGLVCSKSKVTVYVKMIPSDDDESKKAFSELLGSFKDEKLNYDTYMASCSTISFNTMGIISENVLSELRLERYQRLNIDLTSVFGRSGNEDDDRALDIMPPMLMEESDSIDSQHVSTMEDDNGAIDDEPNRENAEHQETNSTSLTEIFSGNDNGDQSVGSDGAATATHEEWIEQPAEINHAELDLITRKSSKKRSRKVNRVKTSESNSFENEYDTGTIAERILNRQRKRKKPSVK